LTRRLVDAICPIKLPYSTSCHCPAVVIVVANYASLLLLRRILYSTWLCPHGLALIPLDTVPLFHIGGPQRMDAESLRNSGMLSMLTSAEGREKLQSLAAKVGTGAARCGRAVVLCVGL
jgi:hypothetical protein